MPLLPIVEVPDPILRTPSAPIERVDEELERLIASMFDTMYDAPGIGLAAVQVAVPRRLMVIDLQDPEPVDEGEEEGPPIRQPHVFINPEILHRSDARKIYNEGCLSIPEQYAEIERPDVIRLKWLDRLGKPQEDEFDGLMSVCIQHEVDHLDGVLFIDYLSRLKRDMMVKKVVKARKDRDKAAVL